MFREVTMSHSGLHSIIDIWVCGIIVGGDMNLGSLICQYIVHLFE